MKYCFSIIIVLLTFCEYAPAQHAFIRYKGNSEDAGLTLTSFNNNLYFISGSDLYGMHKLAAAPSLVHDIYPNQVHCSLWAFRTPTYFNGSYDNRNLTTYLLIEHNNLMFLSGFDNTYTTEVMVMDTNKNIKTIFKSRPGKSGVSRITGSIYKNRVYFVSTDTAHHYGLWSTDGTDTGTHLVKQIEDSISSTLTPFVIHNNQLFFIATDKTHGSELWVSDGSEAGTRMVKDIYPGPFGQAHNLLAHSYNGRLYFTAIDGIHGAELWSTDGTDTGTYLFKDIYPGKNLFMHNFPLYTYNNKLFFGGSDSVHGPAVWVTDGTATGTYMLKDIHPTDNAAKVFSLMQEYNGTLYFSAIDTGASYGYYLWKTDGTIAGTQKTLALSTSHVASLSEMFVYSNRLYFTINTQQGFEMYRTDGTATGTKLITPALATQKPTKILIDSMIFFTADYTGVMNLWSMRDTTRPPLPPPPPTISIEDINANTLPIHPNPVTDILIVTGIKQQAEVSITTITGKHLKLPLEYRDDKLEINTASLPAGMYIIRIGEQSSRFVKQ